MNAVILATILAFASSASAQASHTFAVANGQFQFDGHPYQILSGEMHYPRVPRAYWHDRFRKARAMGLNTITTYVFWNIHEPRPGVYDFSGQNDIAEYIREAQQEALTLSSVPAPTSAPSGISAVIQAGCSRTSRSFSAPPIRSTSQP